MEIKGSSFAELLSHVNFKGLVDECIVTVKNGSAQINTVDTSNSLFISTKKKIMKEGTDMVFGIGNLPALQKFTENEEEIKFSLDEKNNKLVLKKPYGKIQVPLLDPAAIGTHIPDSKAGKKLAEACDVSMALEIERVQNFLEYTQFTEKDIAINFSVNSKKLVLKTDPSDSIEFAVSFGKCPSGNLNVKVYAGNLIAVFQLVISSGAEAELMLKDEMPVVIKAGNSIWALTPLSY